MKYRILNLLGIIAAWLGFITMVLLTMAFDADNVSTLEILYIGGVSLGSFIAGALAMRTADDKRR